MPFTALSALLGLALLALDQWVKHYITLTLPLGETRPLLPGFVEWKAVHNYGAAWSSFSGARWLLVAATSCIVLALLALLVPLALPELPGPLERMALPALPELSGPPERMAPLDLPGLRAQPDPPGPQVRRVSPRKARLAMAPLAPRVLQGRLFMHNSNFCLVMGR